MANNFLFKAGVFSLLFVILFFLSAIIFSQVLLKSEAVIRPRPRRARRSSRPGRSSRRRTCPSPSGAPRRATASRRVSSSGRNRLRARGSAATTVVQVFTSSGSGTVTVPDLASKSLDEALTLLQAAGLTRGRLTQVHTPRVPAGRILAQKPEPGSVVERSFPVGLLLSQGDLEDRYIMPDLIGRRADSVIGRLDSRGFKVADVRYVYYPGAPAGLVVKQDPPNGFRVQKRNRISIEVSR